MSGRQQQHQQSFNERYTTLILEDAEKLFNELTTKLINEVNCNSRSCWGIIVTINS